MKFWDASAVVPLIVVEATSEQMEDLWGDDPQLLTWLWTPVEVASAVERRARDSLLDRQQRAAALDRLARFSTAWDEVTDVSAVRRRAQRLLAQHPLRAADAGQLAAALLAAEDSGAALDFVCLDGRLAEAAQREGLRALPEYLS